MDAESADDPGPRPDDDVVAAAQPVAVLEELLAARGEHLLRTAVLAQRGLARGCACSATRPRCPTAPRPSTSAIRSSGC